MRAKTGSIFLLSAAVLTGCVSSQMSPTKKADEEPRWYPIALTREGAEVHAGYEASQSRYADMPRLDVVQLRIDLNEPKFDRLHREYGSISERWGVDCTKGVGVRFGTYYYERRTLQGRITRIVDSVWNANDLGPSTEVTAICRFLREEKPTPLR